ncbi:hypothetical protein [Streptomyces angustmyceticus]|uniref:hypothetical protein n=1 Tax=Streptomyces angustmyceticus TaxID=285578 RepID=UPI003D8D01EC
MTPGGDRRVRISGDVRGQVVVGDHNIVVSAERSVVTVVREGERPVPRRRESVALLPRRPRSAVGRDAELSTVTAALDDDGAAQVSGPAGVGKSTLLRLAAHRRAEAGEVAFVDAAGREVGDVLQDVFEACYDASGYRPSRTELRRLMSGVDVALVLDDLDCASDELDGLLDTFPDAPVLSSGVRRTLWGRGRSLALDGLRHDGATALLAQALGRPLGDDEEAVAEALWRATSGSPLQLLRAAADGRLARAAELEAVLPGLLAGLSERDSGLMALLALAGQGGVGTALLSELGGGDDVPGRCERLVATGLAVATGHGYRVSPDLGTTSLAPLRPGPSELVDLAERMARWADSADRDPAQVADGQALITAVIEAASRAQAPQAGARLARAAAPAAARSLRLGAWGRILERGRQAAEQAGDAKVLAYLTHEDGIRQLVSGKRAAAAVAFAAAGELWTHLGNHGGAASAQHAQHLCGPQATTAPPDGGLSGGAHTGAAPADGHAAVHDPSSAASQGVPVHSAPPADPGTAAATATGGHTAGLGLTAKVVIGGGLLATTAAGMVLTQHRAGEGTVPVRVVVHTDVLEARMPGKEENGCEVSGGTTDCTTVVHPKKGTRGPVEVRPADPLPAGTSLIYWGCDGGPASASCTLTASRPRTVCVTTTSPQDAAARDRCARLTGSPAPASVFRPMAWVTGTHVEVLSTPQGKPRVLATVGGAKRPGTVVWSRDRSRLAWTEIDDPGTAASLAGYEPSGTIHLKNLRTGDAHSWECNACDVAFLGDELISSAFGGADLWSYPVNGGARVKRTFKGLPPRSPNLLETPAYRPLASWQGDGLVTYVTALYDDNGKDAEGLYRLSADGTAAPVLRRDPGNSFRAISPDGTRVLVTRAVSPATASCEEKSYETTVVSLSSGGQSAAAAPGAGWAVADAWFAPGGAAEVTHRHSRTDREATGHCALDHGAAPRTLTLRPGSGSWSAAAKTGDHVRDVGGGWQAHTGPAGSAAPLTLTKGREQRTLATGVVGVFPSSSH